jgi:hypothetical protein
MRERSRGKRDKAKGKREKEKKEASERILVAGPQL